MTPDLTQRQWQLSSALGLDALGLRREHPTLEGPLRRNPLASVWLSFTSRSGTMTSTDCSCTPSVLAEITIAMTTPFTVTFQGHCAIASGHIRHHEIGIRYSHSPATRSKHRECLTSIETAAKAEQTMKSVRLSATGQADVWETSQLGIAVAAELQLQGFHQ